MKKSVGCSSHDGRYGEGSVKNKNKLEQKTAMHVEEVYNKMAFLIFVFVFVLNARDFLF